MIACQSIEINKINEELVIINSKPIKIIENYDILLHLINLTKFQNLVEQLENTIEKTTHVKNTVREEIKTIKIKLETIIPHHIIVKRGWINIIGTGIKTIFGNLDSEDGRIIKEKLDNLEDVTKTIVRNNNKQIEINDQFNQQFKQLKNIFEGNNVLNNHYNAITYDILELRKEMELNKNILKLQKMLEKINDVILTSRSGMLTQDLITIKEIKDYELNLEKLRQIKITLATYKNNLLIIMNIPKFSKTTYNEIMLENFPKENKIIKLKEKLFIQQEEKIFPYFEIITNKQVLQDNCLNNLLLSNTKLNCSYENFNQENIVYQIQNVLIIKNIKNQTLTQDCNTLKYVLNGNYIIKSENCTLNLFNNTYSFKIYENNLKMLNIPEHEVHINNINELQIRDIDNLEKVEFSVSQKNVTYGISSIILIVLIIVIILLILRKRQTILKMSTTTVNPVAESYPGGVMIPLNPKNTKGVFSP